MNFRKKSHKYKHTAPPILLRQAPLFSPNIATQTGHKTNCNWISLILAGSMHRERPQGSSHLMPAFSAVVPGVDVTITAGWGGTLWAQVIVGSLALGGTIVMSKAPSPKTTAPATQPNFLEGPAFHKLQAELVIRQSYAKEGEPAPI